MSPRLTPLPWFSPYFPCSLGLQPLADPSPPTPPARYADYATGHKHATAFDLVLWATMVGAFELAEVFWKHKSCESPLRVALIGQAHRRDLTPRPSAHSPLRLVSASSSPSRAAPPTPPPSQP